MNSLVIRHGVARKNLGANRVDAGVFSGPLLTPRGFSDAQDLGTKLRYENIDTKRIATSQTLRSIQTAIAIGGREIEEIETYSLLNEVSSDIDEEELIAMLAEGSAPDEALEAGEIIIANPPIEPIWISHRLTIAGLTAVVRIRQGLPVKGYNLLTLNLEKRDLEI